MATTGLVTLVVPREYGYVVLSATSLLFIATWHSFRVGPFRKAAKIPYPQHYALPVSSEASATSNKSAAELKSEEKAAYLFNCAQRAHGNFLESFPIALPAMLISGLKYPTTAAVLGAVWGLGRVVYAVGYTNPKYEKGEGRLYGAFYAVAQLGLLGLSGATAYQFIA